MFAAFEAFRKSNSASGQWRYARAAQNHCLSQGTQSVELKIEKDARVRAGMRMLVSGVFVSLIDSGVACVWANYSRCLVSLASALSLLLLVPVLRRTRSLNLAFAAAGGLASAACLSQFLISGELFYVAVGISIPIGVTMCTSPLTGLGFSVAYAVAALSLTIAVGQNWITPQFPGVELRGGNLVACIITLLTMAVVSGSSVYRESVINAAEQNRRLSDALRQKQNSGLRLLAETTTELVSVEPNEERWARLLDGIAGYLDCDFFTNYEVQVDKLRLVASSGLPESLLPEYRLIDLGDKVFGLCAQGEKPIYLTASDLTQHENGVEITKLGFRVVAAVPLIFGEKLVGTLAFASSRKSAFASEELDFIRTIGQAIASVRGRSLADAQKRASESRFRTVIDHAAHSFFLIDSDGRFIDVNLQACFMLGYERDELLKLRVPDVVVGFTKELVSEIPSCRLAEKIEFKNSVYRRKDGTEFPVEVHLSHVSLGGADHVIALARDASDRQALADRMIQSQKMEAIGRLAGGVAHDFNNLLCVINSYSELLMDAPSLSESQRTWMGEIFNAGQRGADLTRQLLVFGRRAVFKPKAIDMNEVVVDAQRLLERLIGENITLESNLSPMLCVVLADRTQVDQVLINLAVNARDAMPRGGTLTLQTVPLPADNLSPNERVQLIVTDTGSGIAAELLPKVFDPFFTTKGVGEGTGLGLAVAYGIVKESGGSITVASEIGKGTSFTITLPAHATSQPIDEPQTAPPSVKTKTIVLLVEDEPAVRKVTSLSLRQLGYEVLEAQSSRHAIELAMRQSHEINVLLTDVIMPELNGPEIVRELRSFLPQLPVLYMSGYTYDVIEKITDLGENHVLLKKPFSQGELAACIEEVNSTNDSQSSSSKSQKRS